MHSNSWGSSYHYSYTHNSHDVDKYLYEHPDFLVVLAAGNYGEYGSKTVIPPSDAKNAVCVGALELRDPIVDDLLQDITVAWFSSHGPTQDGRIKPDIVAPGSVVKSTLSLPLDWHLGAVPIMPGISRSNNKEPDPCCSTHSLMGTSMATPIVAGNKYL